VSTSTSIPTVGVVLHRRGRVLLVRHRSEASHPRGVCGLPAGRVGPGEDLCAAAIRELPEETGLTTSPEHLIRLPEMYAADLVRSDGSTARFTLVVFICGRAEAVQQAVSCRSTRASGR
jgi:8-oxo-dGTP pyrophosphatase MutT (NUDIX family)